MTDIRHRHHRTRDHFGADLDLYVVIDEPLGPFEQYTPVKYVLEYIYGKLAALASTTDVHVTTFTINAYVLAGGGSIGSVPGNIRQAFSINAVTKRNKSGTFTVNSYVRTGGSFTIDGYIAFNRSFTINAFVV